MAGLKLLDTSQTQKAQKQEKNLKIFPKNLVGKKYNVRGLIRCATMNFEKKARERHRDADARN